jgi:FKBP-type peptidyl-prolyl cis-trans isomerase SlyD
LAGTGLRFVVTVIGVRAATEEEVAHGHVHGDGGHDH